METIYDGQEIRFQRHGRVFDGTVRLVQEVKGELYIQVEYEDFRHFFSKIKVQKITWIKAIQVL